MSLFSTVAVLLALAALFGFINQRLLKLPDSIGLLVTSLFAGIILVSLDPLTDGAGTRSAADMLNKLELGDALLNGLLAFLLFAAAIHVDLTSLWDRRWLVLALSTVGVIISTVLMGAGTWMALYLLGNPLPILWCLVLGAILSPTDPVVVAGLLKRIGLPPELEATIMGESLFNDGVAVVLFTTLVGLATVSGTAAFPHLGDVARTMLGEAGGGMLLGAVLGGAGLFVLRRTREYGQELVTTLALAAGSYACALALHVSAPIAVVAAGLVISANTAMVTTGDEAMDVQDRSSREHVRIFWTMLDHVLKALLFLALGLSVITLDVGRTALIAALAAIPMAVASRFLSVALPVMAMPLALRSKGATVGLLTWGGLRGGISVALALSVPAGPFQDALLPAAYAVTVWTIIVQGLSMNFVVKRLYPMMVEAPVTAQLSAPDSANSDKRGDGGNTPGTALVPTGNP